MSGSTHTPRYRELLKALVEARKKVGLSQIELARRLKRPQSFVSKYERGERRLDVVELTDIAEELGLSVSDLLATVAAHRPDSPTEDGDAA